MDNWLEPEGYMFGLDGGPQSPRETEGLFNELIGPEEVVCPFFCTSEMFV